MKVVVIIPVHCAPKVAMMTIGSWLEAANGSYTAEVILGVHENYHHYHPGLESLQRLPVRLSTVPEMNWVFQTHQEHLLRYSKMHAINLKAAMKVAETIGFDYLAILDHDLVFHQDFIGYGISTQADLIGNYLEDRVDPVELNTDIGRLTFAPKFSVWHLLMTAKFYQKIGSDLDLIFPAIEGGCFYDTFSKVIEANQRDWKMPVKVLSKADIGGLLQHRWSMSFNLGQMIHGHGGYHQRLAQAEAEYDQRFPNGIEHLFQKVRA